MTAAGVIVYLWLWASQYAPNGELQDFDEVEDVGAGCGLPPDKSVGILEKLITSGLVDEKNGKKVIHDWKKHGLKLLESQKERQRKYVGKKKLEEENKCHADVTVTATVPYLTVPNLTIREIYALVLNDWNEFAGDVGLSAITKLSDKRRSGLRQRLSEKQFDLPKIKDEIRASSFMRGEKGWKVDFDFVYCSSNNYLKIIEGKYRNAGSFGNGEKLKVQSTRPQKTGAGGATTPDDIRRTFEGTVFG